MQFPLQESDKQISNISNKKNKNEEFHVISPSPKKLKFLPPINSNNMQYYNGKEINSPIDIYSSEFENEYFSDIKINNYYPVNIGEVLVERYIIKQKLGDGNFSTCWLAFDLKFGNYVAIKIKKSDSLYIEKDYGEVEILQEIEDHNFDEDWIKSLKEYYKDDSLILTELETIEYSQIVQLLNCFLYQGKKGEYFCKVYEIMGVNLLEIIKRYNYKGIPLPYVRIIVRQILIGLDFLHRICHIIHTDLTPENILISLNKDELITIQETGHFEVQESMKRNNNETKSFSDTYSNSINDSNYKISRNKNISKIKRQKSKQIKRLEKFGFSPKKNFDQLILNNNDNDAMDINSDSDSKKNNEKDIDINNYDLQDLIERPRILSVPKYNKDNASNKDSEYYDIDLLSYRNDIQSYIKEKKRIIKDEKYRNKLMMKEKLLSEAKTEKQKKEIFRRLNKQYNEEEFNIDPDINVKLYDFGNASRFNSNYNKIIQTRQYRSPEVILGINYNETTDLWSLACIVFELATGEYLFNPHKDSNYSKNDDHLAKFIQILGKMPKNFALRGTYSHKYFNKEGKLKRINESIQYTNLEDILIKKYHFKENEAKALNSFIMPMLEYYPEKRATARQMLKHPWLKMPANFDYLMNDVEIGLINTNQLLINKYNLDDNNKFKDINSSYSELCKADDEDNDNDNNNTNNDLKEEEDDSGDENPDKIIISNFNNSFAEYGQFIDLTSLDRANPQFDQILKKEEADF